MGKGGQKAHTSSLAITKYSRKVMYSMVTIVIHTVWYI